MLAVAILINDVGKNMEVRKWVLGIFLPPSSYQMDEVRWQANERERCAVSFCKMKKQGIGLNYSVGEIF